MSSGSKPKARGRRLEAIGALSAVFDNEDGDRVVHAVAPGDRVPPDDELVQRFPENFRYPRSAK